MTVGYLASHVTWSVLVSAADFSTFAGVLAGFVFLAMVETAREMREHHRDVAAQPEAPSPADRQLPLMVGAFFSFVVAAFLFGVLHGELYDQTSIKPSIHAICPSIALAIGVVQLATSLAVRLREQYRAIGAANWVAYATIVIALVFLSGIVVSPFFQFDNLTNPPLDPWLLWIVAMAVMALPLLALIFRKSPLSDLNFKRSVHLSIAIGVAAALMQSVLISTLSVLPLYASWIGRISLGVVLIVVGTPIAALALEVGRRRS